jgi:uncharacterized membrane protein YhhN
MITQAIYIGVTLVVAALNWLAAGKGVRWLEAITKPAVMLCLLTWVGFSGGLTGWLGWFFVGLICCLMGDVLLILPGDWFIYGLIAFLLGHIAYTIGFNPSLPPVNVVSLILIGLVGGVGFTIYRRIVTGARASGQGRLTGPVLAYIVIISLMLLSAVLTLLRPDWSATAGGAAVAGALLFYISDSVLAWGKFISPVKNGHPIVMITYHLAQILIAFAALTHFIVIR